MPKFLNKSEGSSGYKCTVSLLEDTDILELEFLSNQKGKDLLDRVCEELNLVEKDYFGLRYVDIDKQRHWLDVGKSILKQVRDLETVSFCFRVKFYPPSPFQLKECITRYQIYLQLRKDLQHGRLFCDNDSIALLGALVLQAELGDYDPLEHYGNYASKLKIFFKQTPSLEERIMEVHQIELRGQTPEQVESEFLRIACTLDTYGIDPHVVKDQRGSQLYLGINYSGILTFQSYKKTNHFRWSDVQKLNYEGKMFIVHLIYFEKKSTTGFKCSSSSACRHLWRCAIEQMLFFTSSSSSNVRAISGGSFFSWGSKFKYSGRVEREVLEEMEKFLREEPPINRVGSVRRKASSVPATPSTPVLADGYSTASRGNYSMDNQFNNMEFGELIHPGILLNRVDEIHEGHNINSSSRYRADEVDLNSSAEYTPNMTTTDADISNVNESLSDFTEVGRKGPSVESNFFYNRSSMDHSSSETHLPACRLSNRSGTPIGRSAAAISNSIRQMSDQQNIPLKPHTTGGVRSYTVNFWGKIKRFVKSCLPSLTLTLISLLIVLIITFETDFEILALLRRAPEMIKIRRQYYEPTKEYFKLSYEHIGKEWKRLMGGYSPNEPFFGRILNMDEEIEQH